MHCKPFYLGGAWTAEGAGPLSVRSSYSHEVIVEIQTATRKQLEEAITKAYTAFTNTRLLGSFEKSQALLKIASQIVQRKQEFIQTLMGETGKIKKDAEAEVNRCIQTFSVAAEEAKRMGGEILDLDWMKGHEGRIGLIRRFPLGVVGGITPFNFPLNLVAHKLAPAIACGAPIVLKPASATPQSALLLAECVDATSLPKGMVSVLPMKSSDAELLTTHPFIKIVSFTGSADVGFKIAGRALGKKLTLELGGNAGVIIEPDATFEQAVNKVVNGGFAVAGQSCISVQRVLVQETLYPKFLQQLKEKVNTLKLGDPAQGDTDIGPLIDELSALRVEEWVNEAKQAGGVVVTGGRRHGNLFEPTILTRVPKHLRIWSEEAFAPLVVVESYQTFDEALEQINASAYGLQTGIFTSNIQNIFKAYEQLEVGGVIINDVPTYRADHMPYGGIKRSGLGGREGVRFAMEEMTEPKILVLNLS